MQCDVHHSPQQLGGFLRMSDLIAKNDFLDNFSNLNDINVLK